MHQAVTDDVLITLAPGKGKASQTLAAFAIQTEAISKVSYNFSGLQLTASSSSFALTKSCHTQLT